MDPIEALQQLITQTATNVPVPTISSLDWTPPTGMDMDAKWREFLTRASQDPDIINYYKTKLDEAKGDLTLAISFLDKDYFTNTRQIKDNLSATLESLGLQSTGESQTLADSLNRRGIALTQEAGQPPVYAGGGQAKTEVTNLGDAQRLRKEAEIRSSSQGIETAGMTREKSLTSAGQGLQQTAQNLQKSKEQEILNRGQTYYGIYQNQQAAEANKKIAEQNNNSGSQSSGKIDKSMINPATGKSYAVNPSSGVWDDNYFAQNYG